MTKFIGESLKSRSCDFDYVEVLSEKRTNRRSGIKIARSVRREKGEEEREKSIIAYVRTSLQLKACLQMSYYHTE